jgi:tellurite methyltransferase
MSDERSAAAWRAYYDATAGRPPRQTLLWALERAEAQRSQRRAVDLGCGDGRDTIELLRRGWSVTAIDAENLALERLAARPDLPAAAALTPLCGKFQDVTWPETDLVNASFVLPLCPPPLFPALWRKITASLASGGRFAGQLYGPRDSWARDPAMTIFDEAGVRALLAAYAVERFEVEESDAITPRGKQKHWHLFHIVARKA